MKTQIAKFLHRIGISADLLTVIGVLLAGLAGWLAFQGHLFWAAAALVSSGLVDMLDGAVARVSGKHTYYGGILDSTLDRYGDAFVFIGLVFYFFDIARADLAGWTVSAWTGSFIVSYVRARAECEIDACRVGFWERGERVGVLTLGMAAANPGVAVMILGIGTHWTVLQRLRAAAPGKAPQKAPGRADAVYFCKIAALAAALLFVRLP